MLRVWVDGKSVGTLDRFKTRGSTFAYDPATAPVQTGDIGNRSE
jgi:hypothetical protein